MADYQSVISISDKILHEHHLCDNCLGRLFSKQLRLSSNRLLGKKIRKNPESPQKCYICKGLFCHLESFLNMMVSSSDGYCFSTFSVGAIIKPSIVDRDDSIRSKYKLKGVDSIKTDITKELGKLYSRKTKRTIDFMDPDATFTVNIKEQSCDLRTKSIVLSGRYVKTSRHMLQKQESCINCLGKGCRSCDFHGISEFDSVEGLISKFLFEQYGGTTAKFTWIGGEDKASLVLGSGRPFFAKIQNPLKRTSAKSSAEFDSLKITCLKTVLQSPKQPIRFNSSIKMSISSESEVSSVDLRKLKKFTGSPIVIYSKSGKRMERKIFSVKYKKVSKNEFFLFIVTEGGLPVRRFVLGDDVVPGVSQTLDVACVCNNFDFLDVDVQ